MAGAFNTPQDQTLYVNGTDLASLATIAASLSPLLTVPERRTSDLVIPNRHGTLPMPYKPYKATAFTLPLLVKGSAADGSIPAGSTAQKEFYARVDSLVGLFQAGDTVNLMHVLPDGTLRSCVAEVVGVMDWTRSVGNRPIIGRVSISLILPDVFWFEPTLRTIVGSLLTAGTMTLSPFIGSNAPITDLVLTLGPGNNPQVIQGTSFFAYDGVIAAGRQLVVDCGSWTLGTGTGSAWTPDYSAVRYSPGPPWFVFDPNDGPQVTLTHTTGTGTLMSLSISGYRKFFNG